MIRWLSFHNWLRTKSQKLTLWWMCGCRSKIVPGTNSSFNLSVLLFRVSSLVLNTCGVTFFLNTFSKRAVTTMSSPRSEFAMTLVASRPENAFIDLIFNSFLGATKLSIAVKIPFRILSPKIFNKITIFPINPFFIASFQEVFHIRKRPPVLSKRVKRMPSGPTFVHFLEVLLFGQNFGRNNCFNQSGLSMILRVSGAL